MTEPIAPGASPRASVESHRPTPAAGSIRTARSGGSLAPLELPSPALQHPSSAPEERSPSVTAQPVASAGAASAFEALKAALRGGLADDEAGVPQDVHDRLDANARVLAEHGLTSSRQVDKEVFKAVMHDAVLHLMQAIGADLGYRLLFTNATYVAPAMVKEPVVSKRGAATGAMTVTTTSLTGTLATALAEGLYAAGAVAEMPPSAASRASAAQSTLMAAALAFVADGAHQLGPLIAAAADWRAGVPVNLAHANRTNLLLDSQLRVLGQVALVLAQRGFGAQSYSATRQAFLLQPPERLGHWLTQTEGLSAGATLVPDRQTARHMLEGLPTAMRRLVTQLPNRTLMAGLGATMIAAGLLAASGRASEYASAKTLPAGTEDPQATFERRAIFGGAEALLESLLTVLVPVVNGLSGGALTKTEALLGKGIDKVMGWAASEPSPPHAAQNIELTEPSSPVPGRRTPTA